jgi:predicted outer membrane repeat protein
VKEDRTFLCLEAGGRGGAIYNDQSGWNLAPRPPHAVDPPVFNDSFVVISSVFDSNSAAGVGGALAITASCGPSVAATTFEGNSASSGGAIFVGGTGLAPCDARNETVLNAVRADSLLVCRGHATWHSEVRILQHDAPWCCEHGYGSLLGQIDISLEYLELAAMSVEDAHALMIDISQSSCACRSP